MPLRSNPRVHAGRRVMPWKAAVLAAVVSAGCAQIAGLHATAKVCEDEDCLPSGEAECSLDVPDQCGSGQVCSGGSCVDVTRIAAGGATTCAVLTDGQVWCWGQNAEGQSGQVEVHSIAGTEGTIEIVSPESVLTHWPSPVRGLEGVTHIAVGGDDEHGHACALTGSGELWCWGDNRFHQARQPALEGAPWATPDRLELQSASVGKVLDVRVGVGRTCFIGTRAGDDGGEHKLWCWGDNTAQQTNPEPGDVVGPDDIELDAAVEDVVLGQEHTCALSADRKVRCWGNKDVFSCGGWAAMEEVPLDGLHAYAIAAGAHHTCATTDAGVYCWGSNAFGQVGTAPSGTECVSPTLVAPLEGPLADGEHALEIAAGGQQTCVSWPSGDVTCWGLDATGNLPGLAAVDLTLGSRHACVRRTSGEVECWGRNDAGQLGQGKRDEALYESPEVVKWYDETIDSSGTE
jgi:alpha-tubulin suppressor-like RCC1 family protein